MASRNKGFDPLSSLFEAPEPQRGLPLPEVDDDGDDAAGAALGLTDPLQGRQAAALPAETDEVALPEDDPEDKEALAKKLAAEALARARAGAAQAAEPAAEAPAVAEPVQDKAALARKLAAQAVARAQAGAAQAAEPTPAEAPAEAPAEDKLALARRLAAQAKAKAESSAGAPPPPPGKATPGKATPGSSKDGAPQDAAPKHAAPEHAAPKHKGAPPASERKKKARSRVDALAARAKKPISALQAARVAAKQEEERQVQALRQKENELRDVVQDLIPAWLPGISTVYVANAIAVKDRDVLQALWKAHRTKFLADGQLERAVGAAAVLAALDNSSDGHLVAAHAVTDASDYLVWLDLDKNSLVAAFPDARAYFANPS